MLGDGSVRNVNVIGTWGYLYPHTRLSNVYLSHAAAVSRQTVNSKVKSPRNTSLNFLLVTNAPGHFPVCTDCKVLRWEFPHLYFWPQLSNIIFPKGSPKLTYENLIFFLYINLLPPNLFPPRPESIKFLIRN